MALLRGEVPPFSSMMEEILSTEETLE